MHNQLTIEFDAMSKKDIDDLKAWYYNLPVRSYSKQPIRLNPFLYTAVNRPAHFGSESRRD
jgi:hypothetical protein